MCWYNRNGNGKKASRFICLKCLDWKTTYIPDIQRPNQREKYHVKDTECIRCGKIKSMEVRHCDYLPDVMRMAIKRHNKDYNDNIRKITVEHYGIICV